MKRPLIERVLAPLLSCLLFVLLALPWLDKPGMQTDETLFAAAIYPPFHQPYVVQLFGREVPLMTMTYVGALKSWIWALLLKVLLTSPVVVRMPAVLLSSISVWWVYSLLSRSVGRRAAIAAAALLATDPVYILYSRYDHGPVVIQHLCLVGSMLALLRFHQERRTVWLFLGLLALGLGMWEKAVFVWLIAGLGIAGVLVFARQIWAALSIRNIAVAGAGFLIGTTPLIVYNVRNDFATFRSNTKFDPSELPQKVNVLRATFNGSVQFGGFIREAVDGPIRQPESAMEKAVVSLASSTGNRRFGLLGYLAVGAILLSPLLWRDPAPRRMFLFVLICGTVAWLQMAITKNAGAAAHHTILLWPLPIIAIAVVLAQLPRLVLWPVVAIAAGANVLVLSSYYTNLVRNGGTPSWTDAMYPAIHEILRTPRDATCMIDWGFGETMRLYERGKIPICYAENPADENARPIVLRQISNPRHVFLTHTEGNESFPGVTARFVAFAEANGFRRFGHRVFADTNGRKTVEVFQFEKAPQASFTLQ
jgi:4-amino-4-deoxy-L-arabinose transferase-like glycosyltransferase